MTPEEMAAILFAGLPPDDYKGEGIVPTPVSQRKHVKPVAWVHEWAPGAPVIGKSLHWTPYTCHIEKQIIRTPLYAAPQRQPLTEDEISDLAREMVKGGKSANWLARAVEAAHGITGETK